MPALLRSPLTNGSLGKSKFHAIRPILGMFLSLPVSESICFHALLLTPFRLMPPVNTRRRSDVETT